MRPVRRLPPMLRALRVLYVLAMLAALGVLTWASLAQRGTHQLSVSQGWNRVSTITWSLLLLAAACTVPSLPYNRRFAPPGGRTPRPATWQAQLMVVLALAALPLCSLVFALLVPPASSGFPQVFVLQILSLPVLIAGYLWVFFRSRG